MALPHALHGLLAPGIWNIQVILHNSPIFDECQTQSAKVLAMFWPCHENRLIKTIQTIPHNLYVSVKLTCLYCGLRLILVYLLSEGKLTCERVVKVFLNCFFICVVPPHSVAMVTDYDCWRDCGEGAVDVAQVFSLTQFYYVLFLFCSLYSV